MTTATTTPAAIQTTKIRGGAVVLAKSDKFGNSAVKYANRKQADARRESLAAAGVAAEVFQAHYGPVFYLRIA